MLDRAVPLDGRMLHRKEGGPLCMDSTDPSLDRWSNDKEQSSANS